MNCKLTALAMGFLVASSFSLATPTKPSFTTKAKNFIQDNYVWLTGTIGGAAAYVATRLNQQNVVDYVRNNDSLQYILAKKCEAQNSPMPLLDFVENYIANKSNLKLLGKVGLGLAGISALYGLYKIFIAPAKAKTGSTTSTSSTKPA